MDNEKLQRILRRTSIFLTTVFALLYLVWALPYFKNQAQVGFFSYTPEFVQPFFEGFAGNGQAAVSQGLVAPAGVLSDGSQAGKTPPHRIRPRITEFLWRFISQFYLNTPLILLVTSAVTFGFCFLAWTVTGPFTLLLLPIWFYYFSAPEPVYASFSMTLLLAVAALAGFFKLSRRTQRWVYAPIAAVSLFLVCFLWSYTPPMLRTHTRQEHTFMRIRQAGEKEDFERCLRLCEKILEKAAPEDFSSAPKAVQKQYFETLGWLKLSLLKTGRLNNRFLKYAGYEGMEVMFPSLFPFEYECGFPYVKLYEALGMYPPQVPFILSLCERNGWQNRYMHALAEAEIHTNQYRLAQKTLRYCKRTLAHVSWAGRMNTGGGGAEDGARPVALNSMDLVRASRNLDGWVKCVFENTVFNGRLAQSQNRLHLVCMSDNGLDLEEKPLYLSSAWRPLRHDSVFVLPDVADRISMALLDYYSLLCLMERRTGLAGVLTELYAKKGAASLPDYLQEALYFSVSFPSGLDREILADYDFYGFRLNPAIAGKTDAQYRAWASARMGKITFNEAAKLYPDTFTRYLLFN